MQPIKLYLLVRQRQRRIESNRASLPQRFKGFLVGLVTILVLGIVGGIVAAAIGYVNLTADLPSVDTLRVLLDPQTGPLLQPTRLYDRTGQHLLYSLENPGIARRYLPIDPSQPEFVSPQLVRATVAVLEPNFWQSPGYHWNDLTAPDPATIAERLVLRLLLWREEPGTRRSLRMRLLAAQVVARYGRSQVLEWYLNSENYGHLAFGPESAARLYFGKPASSLNMAESFLLVGVAEAPALNPIDSPVSANGQLEKVLLRAFEQGQITLNEYQQIQSTNIQLAPQLRSASSPAAAFNQLVINHLSQMIDPEVVERGGSRVITSLDFDLQQQINCTIQTQLHRVYEIRGEVTLPDGSPCLAARLLPTLPPYEQVWPAGIAISGAIMDPQTGEVLAYVGDTTLAGESPLLNGHAPGSLLAPLVAAAGFSRGMSPANLVWDIPATLPDSFNLNVTGWNFHGPVRLRTAVANDYLAPVARLLEQLGPVNVWKLAGALGATSLSNQPDSGQLLFQGGNVLILDIVHTYATLAGGGVQIGSRIFEASTLSPITILSVEDKQGQLWLSLPERQQQAVFSSQLAYLVNNMLSDESARWPSLGYPNPLEIGRPAAAKLGVTQDGKNSWTAGYTPQRVAVFWAGLPSESIERRLDYRVVAGTWHAMMQYTSRDLPVMSWEAPSDISTIDVCDPSGLLPTRDCPLIVTEAFVKGNEPVSFDALYQRIMVNRETGLQATVYTPIELTEEKVFLVVPPEARDWAQQSGINLPPAAYDIIPSIGTSSSVQISAPKLFQYVSGTQVIEGTAAGEDFSYYQLQVGQGINPRSWLQ
ncbi:MAG: penicillin-binding protein, partial [Anaerolineaceae bacterium]|nr:penicillin-binding protein [Anaerolineaceae bacterium]